MGPPRPKRYVVMGSRKRAEKKKRKTARDNSRTTIYEKSSEVFHHARVHGGCPFYFGNRTGDQQKQARVIAHVREGENCYQYLARSRARLRAMEAAGNRHWLRWQPAHHERERSNSDRLSARSLHRNWHLGHHRSRARFCVAVD